MSSSELAREFGVAVPVVRLGRVMLVGMARGYRRVDREQVFLLPVDMREWLDPGDPVWWVLDCVARMDTSAFHGTRAGRRTTSSRAGRRGYDPDVMLALLIYAYAVGELSSRRIEALCRTHVAFRVVCGNDVPDHTVIARFRQRHVAAFEQLFGEVLRLCATGGMGDFVQAALDGTKIGANASKGANRSAASLRAAVNELVTRAQEVDAAEADAARHGQGRANTPRALRDHAARRQMITALIDEPDTEPDPRPAGDPEPAVAESDPVTDPDPEPVAEPDPRPAGEPEPAVAESDPVTDPVTDPDPDPDPVAEPHPQPAAAPDTAAVDPDPEPVCAPDPDPDPDPEPDPVAAGGPDPESAAESEPGCAATGPVAQSGAVGGPGRTGGGAGGLLGYLTGLLARLEAEAASGSDVRNVGLEKLQARMDKAKAKHERVRSAHEAMVARYTAAVAAGTARRGFAPTATEDNVTVAKARRAYERARARYERALVPVSEGGLGKNHRMNLTDPDSKLLKTRNGYQQAYNAQLVVSNDYLILAAAISTSSSDTASYIPMVRAAVAAVAKGWGPDTTIATVTADAGYCSQANLTAPGPDRLIATGNRHRDPAAEPEHPSSTPEMIAMREKLATDEGRATYKRRGATVEPLNAHLKDRRGLRRFSMRGKAAVTGELQLAAATTNLMRLRSHTIEFPTAA